MRAIGLNFADVFAVLGLYSLAGSTPLTPGFEVSGVVEQVGRRVTTHRVGDRVFALTRFGGYTTVINVGEAFVHAIPNGWSFGEAAAWPCQAMTAWYALCILGGLNRGACRLLTSASKRVVVHSAAGGVGLHLVELVRHIGGEVIATVGSADKIDVLLARGVPRTRILVRGSDDCDGFERAVRQRMRQGEGVDVVIDPVMGHYFQPGWRLLNRGGRYIVMGSASLMPTGQVSMWNVRSMATLAWRYLCRPRLDLLAAINQNRSVSAFNMGALFDCADVMNSGFDELSQMDMKPPFIGRSFSFDDAHEALHLFRSGSTVGKLVLLVEVNHQYLPGPS